MLLGCPKKLVQLRNRAVSAVHTAQPRSPGAITPIVCGPNCVNPLADRPETFSLSHVPAPSCSPAWVAWAWTRNDVAAPTPITPASSDGDPAVRVVPASSEPATTTAPAATAAPLASAIGSDVGSGKGLAPNDSTITSAWSTITAR